MALTLPSSGSIMRVICGAKIHDSTVIVANSEKASVKRRRTKSSPRSASSFSARTNTGTTSEVSTAPSTISVMRLGSWFAVVKAEEIAGPSDEPMSTLRMNPVMREIIVAMAMEPVARTTAPSEFFSPEGSLEVAAALPFSPERSSSSSSTATTPLGARFSGTGAGGEGVTMRRRAPDLGSCVIEKTIRETSFSSAYPAGTMRQGRGRARRLRRLHRR